MKHLTKEPDATFKVIAGMFVSTFRRKDLLVEGLVETTHKLPKNYPETVEKTTMKIIEMVKEDDMDGINTFITERLGESGAKVGQKWGKTQLKIMAIVLSDGFIPTREMGEIMGISYTAVQNNIAKLKKKGILKRVGPAKGGHWEVVD